MGGLKTFLVSSNLALLLLLSFGAALAYKHPVLGVEEGQGLPAEKLSVDTLKELNDDPGYAEFDEANYVQSSHCWLNVEKLAAQQFADRLKGIDANTIVNLVGEPFSKWKKLSYWRKENEPGEDWIYLLGFESVPVHLRIADNKCVDALVLSDEDFDRYYTYMDDRFSKMVGKSQSQIKALFGEPANSFTYPLDRDYAPSLFFKNGKCKSVGFSLRSGYKSREEYERKSVGQSVELDNSQIPEVKAKGGVNPWAKKYSGISAGSERKDWNKEKGKQP